MLINVNEHTVFLFKWIYHSHREIFFSLELFFWNRDPLCGHKLISNTIHMARISTQCSTVKFKTRALVWVRNEQILQWRRGQNLLPNVETYFFLEEQSRLCITCINYILWIGVFNTVLFVFCNEPMLTCVIMLRNEWIWLWINELKW